MGHLAVFRKGWESEHLATFLLSRLAFVAQPATVSDDVGSDLFCTLFEVMQGILLPLNSFAIQIKSNFGDIEATNKLNYLERLELPFLLGVVDQKNLKLSVYSGEYLPILFCHKKVVGLRLSPTHNSVDCDNYCDEKTDGRYILYMPSILELLAEDTPDDVAKKAREIGKLCSRTLQNISAKISREYIFQLEGSALILAGPGSAETFRRNFCLRLAEAFSNLKWLLENCPSQFRLEEFLIYENCYQSLITHIVPIPPELVKGYADAKSLIETSKAARE